MQALDIWLPPDLGLRERIETIHAAYPAGFVRVSQQPAAVARMSGAVSGGAVVAKLKRKFGVGTSSRIEPVVTERLGEEAYDVATLELRRHEVMRHTILKVRAVLFMLSNESKRAYAATRRADRTRSPCPPWLRTTRERHNAHEKRARSTWSLQRQQQRVCELRTAAPNADAARNSGLVGSRSCDNGLV